MYSTKTSGRFFLSFRSYVLAQTRPLPAAIAFPPTACKFHRSQALRGHKEPPSPSTYYDFFPQTLTAGPPPRGPFAINLPELRKEFYQLQAKAHPDRFPPDQKAKAEGLSARINEAYKALQGPLTRAQYLLYLKGIDVAEDEMAKVEDPELLLEVLETREAIESTEREEQLGPLKNENDRKIEKSVASLEEYFQKNEISRAKDEVVRLRYWTNIKESLDSWEPGLRESHGNATDVIPFSHKHFLVDLQDPYAILA